jgi:hypothetical protein
MTTSRRTFLITSAAVLAVALVFIVRASLNPCDSLNQPFRLDFFGRRRLAARQIR